MQKPVRYYIVKAADQPVVRSVPVVRPEAASAAESMPAGAARSENRDERRERRAPAVARLVRAAIRRHAPDR